MKASELRIGNLVEIDQYPNDRVIIAIESGKDIDIIEKLNGTPIPLTEEWLLNFGFKELNYHKNKFGWINNGVNISNYFNFVLCLPDGEYYDSIKIEYVHQLQNLYFSLTGEELTVRHNG